MATIKSLTEAADSAMEGVVRSAFISVARDRKARELKAARKDSSIQEPIKELNAHFKKEGIHGHVRARYNHSDNAIDIHHRGAYEPGSPHHIDKVGDPTHHPEVRRILKKHGLHVEDSDEKHGSNITMLAKK